MKPQIKKTLIVMLLSFIALCGLYANDITLFYRFVTGTTALSSLSKLPEGYRLLNGKMDGYLVIMNLKNDANQYYLLKSLNLSVDNIKQQQDNFIKIDEGIYLLVINQSSETESTLLWVVDGSFQLSTIEHSPFEHKMYPKELIKSIRKYYSEVDGNLEK